jgi:hypothetical protein
MNFRQFSLYIEVEEKLTLQMDSLQCAILTREPLLSSRDPSSEGAEKPHCSLMYRKVGVWRHYWPAG